MLSEMLISFNDATRVCFLNRLLKSNPCLLRMLHWC